MNKEKFESTIHMLQAKVTTHTHKDKLKVDR
jgi:hypothetical protein